MFPLYDNVPSLRVPLVTLTVIVMNAVVFVWSQGLLPMDQQALFFRWGFVPARIGQLFTRDTITVILHADAQPPGPSGEIPDQTISLAPRPVEIALTLVTYLFLHVDLLHLVGNIWFLWLFGKSVEDRLGHAGYLILYLFGGLAAALAQGLVFLQSPVPIIGASGAIATVLGAYAITWPYARIHTLVFVALVQLPAYLFLGGWFLYQIVSGIVPSDEQTVQRIAWWAHVGGFVTGVLLMRWFFALFSKERYTARSK
jgi:membrane associated rhomboid family serine protease